MASIDRLLQALDARARSASAGAQALIDTMARAAFQQLWDALAKDPTKAPREAIAAIQAEFGGKFSDALAAAFEELLRRSITVDRVRAMIVGDVSLSRRIYLHNVETAAEVTQAIKDHAQGMQEARKLARELFDGYDPRDGVKRPLEGRARAALPRALRLLTEDPQTRQELAYLLARGQKQAARLRSPALRAAYMEVFDAWGQGKGMDALKRKLDIAQREKNRYFADRIARTELHRAHQDEAAAALMKDAETTVVQVMINPMHPKTDICDLHARADLWGLGPGLYPKDEAPVPPYHPHCWCVLRARQSLGAMGLAASPLPGGAAAYLRSLGDEKAAQVMGSRERALEVFNGADYLRVANRGKPAGYRTARVASQAKSDLAQKLEPPST